MEGRAAVSCEHPWPFKRVSWSPPPLPTNDSPVTGADGRVTCKLTFGNVAFGNVAGRGKARVFLGGRAVEEVDLAVSAGPAVRVRIVSGYKQRGEPKQELPYPLVAIVEDAVGNPVNGATVRWAAGLGENAEIVSSASLSKPGTYGDPERPSIWYASDGLVSARVRVKRGMNMVYAVVSLVGSGPSTYGVPNVAILVQEPSLMTKLDGDGQSALAGTDFARPLLVRQTTKYLGVRGPLRGLPVKFTATGGLVLSSPMAYSDYAGRTEVNVVAGSTPGIHTVTATAGDTAVTFRLTVTAK